MNERESRRSLLAEVECEVLEEGREWMRRRVERKLQQAVDKQGRNSPLERAKTLELPGGARDDRDKRGQSGG